MKRSYIIAIVGLLIIVALLLALVVWHEHKTAPPVPKVSTNVPVLGTPDLSPTEARPAGFPSPGPGPYWHIGSVLLPNPALSPGEVRTTDANEVCNEHTGDYRNTSQAVKDEVFAEYGTADHAGVCRDIQRMTKGSRKRPSHLVTEACEVDHIISLELGGADTAANLFPQPYNPEDGLGAHAKDKVENYLHAQVCKHGMPLMEAQNKIAKNWYQIYIDAHLGN